MPGSAVLSGRRLNVLDDLEAAGALLDRLADMGDRAAELAVLILRGRISAAQTAASHPATDDVRSTTSEQVGLLVQEVLAVYAGMLARRERVDGGLCAIADRLLDELAEGQPTWGGLPTILGHEDAFGPLSGVVRLRYPTESVWGLPLVAHELGHHVTFAHTRDRLDGMLRTAALPVADLLEAERRRGGLSSWSHLGELFADVFATWTVGPAYAGSLVHLRLDTRDKRGASYQHPSPQVRLEAVLRTLGVLDELDKTYSPPNRVVAKRLRAWWDRSAATSMATSTAPMTVTPSALNLLVPGVASASGDALASKVDELLTVLRSDFGTVRHRTTSGVACIETLLTTKDPPAGAGRDMRVLDVLTAAWRVRLLKARTDQFATVSRRAEALCSDAVDGTGRRPGKDVVTCPPT